MGALGGYIYYLALKTYSIWSLLTPGTCFKEQVRIFLSEISADLEEMGGENYDYIGEDSSSEPGNPPETRFDEEEPV